ncbi:MAG: UDP-3-O-(3-hydroxymyristoyl)glucosamine N-acyltransferase [Sutterellaceae bacterium]|nr:UDP-3-O-(3-hydroxymyristoyl)glucosamine N-acyltransferase [Burkholderiaceae bacterium]MCX7902475.1 UDP-3-O-(3-hydroxymyristoyl)glucosamine N-acyltransferase [Burkholderiaceae bacterium]MDW8429653.1 UDP-3-O-(3-hydroxymyristoyl)glucosamine N-acyltransferase [Sutterellaceae bacterium]
MPAQRPGRTLAELTEAVQTSAGGTLTARLIGDAQYVIEGVAPLETATPRHLSFLANPRYRHAARVSRAGAMVLGETDFEALRPRNAVICDNPYAWFALAMQVLYPTPAVSPGQAPQAVVAPTARVAAGCRIDAGAVIEAEAEVADGAWIGAGCYVGEGAKIGAGTRLYPGARLLAECQIGARGIVHSGAVIGADGFGFASLAGRWVKLPQIGRVIIGDDVEIGANTTIDRGTMGDTVIEDGVKIDNQVQIGHNCRIGAHTVIAGCVGIAGSARIGRRCQLGGAAMIHGHIEICDDVIVSGGTLISRSIRTPGFYSGVFPFMPNRQWERNAALVRHLHELRDRLRRLEAGPAAEGETT